MLSLTCTRLAQVSDLLVTRPLSYCSSLSAISMPWRMGLVVMSQETFQAGSRDRTVCGVCQMLSDVLAEGLRGRYNEHLLVRVSPVIRDCLLPPMFS